MNYYEHHLGDYDGATVHLTWTEDLAYRRLLCLYYRSEAPIPADVKHVLRLVRAVTQTERKAVQQVLGEFFELRDDGWHQARADKEVARFQDKQRKAKASVKARWDYSREQKSKIERNTNVSTNECERTTDDIHRAPVPKPQTPDNCVVPDGTTPLGERAAPTKRASRLPPNWDPGPQGMAFAAGLGLVNDQATAELAKFRDYWVAKPDGAKLDWQATWRNWVRRVAEQSQPATAAPSGGRHYEVR